MNTKTVKCQNCEAAWITQPALLCDNCVRLTEPLEPSWQDFDRLLEARAQAELRVKALREGLRALAAEADALADPEGAHQNSK